MLLQLCGLARNAADLLGFSTSQLFSGFIENRPQNRKRYRVQCAAVLWRKSLVDVRGQKSEWADWFRGQRNGRSDITTGCKPSLQNTSLVAV